MDMQIENQNMSPPMQLALAANFGSVQRWHDKFVALVEAQKAAQNNASGRLLLEFLPHTGTLVNRWSADEPLPTDPQTRSHTPAASGGVPIVALRVPEPADVHALMTNIDWATAYESYQHAVHTASEDWGISAAELTPTINTPLLLDVRRAGVFEKAESLIPGARWCDPIAVARWAAELPADRDVVVYCVYGHEVGRATALRLRAAGVNARYLQGGIDGWQAEGRPVQVKA
jgi:superoxide dismutase, Fe-Mn family